jgi:hypothetical protein
MSESSVIYNVDKEIVGVFRLGVAWKKAPRKRLGEYDENGIYDNKRKLLATIEDNKVVSVTRSVLGVIREQDVQVSAEITNKKKILERNGLVVGECVGTLEAAGAALVFLAKELS